MTVSERQVGIILGPTERKLVEAWRARIAEIVDEEGGPLDFWADGLPVLVGVSFRFFDTIDERIAAVQRVSDLELRWVARGGPEGLA